MILCHVALVDISRKWVFDQTWCNKALIETKCALCIATVGAQVWKNADVALADEGGQLIVDGVVLDLVEKHWLVLENIICKTFAALPREVGKVDGAILRLEVDLVSSKYAILAIFNLPL